MEELPRHIAIVMDGNGRWALAKQLPRHAGHEAGVASVRAVVEACLQHNVAVLSVFAFSCENWQRPSEEVTFLMGLFLASLEAQISELQAQGIRLRFIGARDALAEELVAAIEQAERDTVGNERLQLVIALNYSGRWDITQATQAIASRVAQGQLEAKAIDEVVIKQHLSIADLPEPDLLIRTSGEQRISNFYLWHVAYSEFYFSDCLWPDFDAEELSRALQWYQQRERRFGKTSAQLQGESGA